MSLGAVGAARRNADTVIQSMNLEDDGANSECVRFQISALKPYEKDPKRADRRVVFGSSGRGDGSVQLVFKSDHFLVSSARLDAAAEKCDSLIFLLRKCIESLNDLEKALPPDAKKEYREECELLNSVEEGSDRVTDSHFRYTINEHKVEAAVIKRSNMRRLLSDEEACLRSKADLQCHLGKIVLLLSTIEACRSGSAGLLSKLEQGYEADTRAMLKAARLSREGMEASELLLTADRSSLAVTSRIPDRADVGLLRLEMEPNSEDFYVDVRKLFLQEESSFSPGPSKRGCERTCSDCGKLTKFHSFRNANCWAGFWGFFLQVI